MQVSFKPRPSEFWVREEKLEGHTTWLIERCYRTGELEEGMVVAHTPAHKPLRVGLWGAVWFISVLMSQDMHKMASKAPTMEEWPSCHAFPTMIHPTGTLWNSEKNAYVRATQVNNTATDITSSHLRTEIFILNFTKLQHVRGKQDKTNQAYSRCGNTHLKLQYLQGTSRRITTSQGKPGLHREILLQNKTRVCVAFTEDLGFQAPTMTFTTIPGDLTTLFNLKGLLHAHGIYLLHTHSLSLI